MKKRFLVLLFIGFSALISAQEISSIENLKIELQKEQVDTAKVSIKLKIANSFTDIDNDSTIYYYNQALELATKINSKPQMAQSYYEIGILYENINDFEKAITNYLKAALFFKELDNIKKAAKIHDYVAYCYSQLYVEDEVIKHYLQSLKLNTSIANDEGIAMNYLGFGNLFYSKENFDVAIKYFTDALEIYLKLDDKDGVAATYTNLGNATADAGDNIKGLEYYEKSIEIQEKLDDQYGIAINYNNIGDSYIGLKEFKKALDYFSKSLIIAEELKENELISVLLMNISDVKFQTKKYLSAIYYADKSLKIAIETGDLEYQADNLMTLSSSHEAIGNVSKAFIYSKQYIEIKDSLLVIDKTNKVKLFQALKELETTQHTMNDLAVKNKITESRYEAGRKFLYFLIGAIVLFGLFVVILIHQQTAKKDAYNLLEYRNHQINKMKDEIQAQRDYLEQLNATKDKLFSIIAHDLKNPFNSIKGFTELMIENSHEYDEEKRLKFLKIIEGSTTRASSLLNNLLIWANSQSGNLEFNPVEVELIQKVSNVTSLLEIQAVNKDIKILNNVAKDIFVAADKNMLATVFRNLISNAIKFTEVKGTVEISSTVNSNFVEVTVKDNGVGISQSDIEDLFSIEVKNSSIGTANEQGSGLGLILCKDFVERHGGKLWVKSALNEGSEFKFTLPITV